MSPTDKAASPGQTPNSAAPQGNTLPSKDDQPSPRLPHERDESSDQQSSSSAAGSAVGRQAHADKASGQVDTDRGPVLDKVYNEKVGRGAEGVADDQKKRGT